MNKNKIIGSGLIFLFICVPIMCKAQTLYSNRNVKTVSKARGKAVRGTLFPLAIGIGSTLIFENDIVETTGSLLAVYGLIVGPSIGNFYARDYWRGFLGAAVRIGGGYLIHDATREIFGDDMADVFGWDDEKVSLTDPRILIGSALILGSAIYNVVSTKASIERYNRKKGYVIGLNPVIHEGRMIPAITARFNF